MRILISHIIPCYFLLVILHSCSDKQDKKKIVYQSFNNELENMRRVVINSSNQMLAELNNKKSDPSTHYKAEKWYANAITIHKLTDSIIRYIQGLKKELNIKNNSSDKVQDSKLSDIKALDKFLDKSHLLYEHLLTYKNNVLKVDNLITEEFKDKLALFTNSESEKKVKKEEIADFFDGCSLWETLLLLRHFENNVRVIEYKTIAFCTAQVGSGENHINYISTIIAQSSTVIKKGESLEITAGVGNFSLSVAPIITINGKKIQVNENGTASHKLFNNSTPGKKTVKVKIEYTDHDGEKLSTEKTVEYLVVE